MLTVRSDTVTAKTTARSAKNIKKTYKPIEKSWAKNQVNPVKYKYKTGEKIMKAISLYFELEGEDTTKVITCMKNELREFLSPECLLDVELVTLETGFQKDNE